MKDRQATIDNYAEAVVDGMDMKVLCAFAIDTIIETLNDYTDEQVIDLVKDYDPDNSLGIME